MGVSYLLNARKKQVLVVSAKYDKLPFESNASDQNLANDSGSEEEVDESDDGGIWDEGDVKTKGNIELALLKIANAQEGADWVGDERVEKRVMRLRSVSGSGDDATGDDGTGPSSPEENSDDDVSGFTI